MRLTAALTPGTAGKRPGPASDPALDRARELYRAGLTAGRVPPIRAIKRDLHVGTTRATAIQAALSAGGQTSQAA